MQEVAATSTIKEEKTQKELETWKAALQSEGADLTGAVGLVPGGRSLQAV